MANYTTGAQRRNARMDKIFEEARELEKNRSKWHCEKVDGNHMVECTSNKSTGVTLWNDGSVRFSKFAGSEVRINGKKTKFMGVELD